MLKKMAYFPHTPLAQLTVSDKLWVKKALLEKLASI
jgi:hypothetical protein